MIATDIVSAEYSLPPHIYIEQEGQEAVVYFCNFLIINVYRNESYASELGPSKMTNIRDFFRKKISGFGMSSFQSYDISSDINTSNMKFCISLFFSQNA